MHMQVPFRMGLAIGWRLVKAGRVGKRDLKERIVPGGQRL